MVDEILQEQEEINRKIDEAYTRLNALEDEDVGVSDELKELKAQRQRFAVLSEVSDQLEKLEKLGGSDLFWGEDYDQDNASKVQKRVRDLVVNYDSRVAELQGQQSERYETVESLTAKINLLNEESLA
ncbi:MAG: hypothetical protein OQK44_07475, partial [Gammaproteobacteria bacterium]|nr:hypothetical protein [Gammaproteobacteria bacterium]